MIAVIVLISAPALSSLFKADITAYIRVLALLVFTVPFTFPTVFWQRDLDFTHPSLAVVVNDLFILLSAVLVEVVFDAGVWSIVIGYISGIIFSTAYIWLFAREHPRLAVHDKQARDILSFGWPFMVENVNGLAMARGDNLLVEIFGIGAAGVLQLCMEPAGDDRVIRIRN